MTSIKKFYTGFTINLVQLFLYASVATTTQSIVESVTKYITFEDSLLTFVAKHALTFSCYAIGYLLVYPFDTVKRRRIVFPYQTSTRIFDDVWEEHGFFGFWSGSRVYLLTGGLSYIFTHCIAMP
mmetsp:Transcript_25327/g.28174  ORF Transcript_25327/g.28174 Transcript_25327/m.28174 type:complete len:125 (+) Transcript_25327:420-794(+)